MSVRKVFFNFRRCPRARYDNTHPGFISIRRTATNAVAAFAALAACRSSYAAHADAGIWDFRPGGRAYTSELKRVCPSKHLEHVSHYDMDEAASTFRMSLRPALRSRVDRAAGYDPRSDETRGCHNIVGVTCEDFHMLEGFHRAGLMYRFVARLCASYVGCVDDANCTTDPDANGSLMSEFTLAKPKGESWLTPSWPPGVPPLPPRNR